MAGAIEFRYRDKALRIPFEQNVDEVKVPDMSCIEAAARLPIKGARLAHSITIFPGLGLSSSP